MGESAIARKRTGAAEAPIDVTGRLPWRAGNMAHLHERVREAMRGNVDEAMRLERLRGKATPDSAASDSRRRATVGAVRDFGSAP